MILQPFALNVVVAPVTRGISRLSHSRTHNRCNACRSTRTMVM